MPKSISEKGASRIFTLIFFLLVLGVAVYFLYNNFRVNLKSGASNVVQSANGILVKRGTAAFTPCGANGNLPYALLQAKVLAATATGGSGGFVTGEPRPSPTPIRTIIPGPTSVPSPISNSACLPLQVNSKLADPLVGQKVYVIGTLQKGIFFATSIKKYANCVQQCPGKDNVLRNCNPPEADGTSQDSICNQAGRTEVCGSQTFCCVKPGTGWTTNLKACPRIGTPAPRPTIRPTPSPIITSVPKPVPTAINFSNSACVVKYRGNCVAASTCSGHGTSVASGYQCLNTPYSCCSLP